MTPPSSDEDVQHLKMLSIGHYVLAGFTAFQLLFGLLFVAVGIFAMTSQIEKQDERGAKFMGVFLVAFAAFWIVSALVQAVAEVFAGRFLSRRSHHTFCFVIAAVECMSMPLGTILGVFTIVVLMRPSVKAMFDSPPPPPAPTPG